MYAQRAQLLLDWVVGFELALKIEVGLQLVTSPRHTKVPKEAIHQAPFEPAKVLEHT
jgi:hypothetical protein